MDNEQREQEQARRALVRWFGIEGHEQLRGTIRHRVGTYVREQLRAVQADRGHRPRATPDE